jgi:hypothetical protein
MVITSSYRKNMEEWERWVREEEERTRRKEEEDPKLREGLGWRWGASCLACWEELAHGEGRGGNRDRGGGDSDGEGSGTEKESADSPTCGGKRREGSRRCQGEGEEDPRETSGNSDREGTRGGDAGIIKDFPLTC